MRFRPAPQRLLCLWLPEWPIQRRLAAHPELRHSVLLLTESTSRGEFVRHANSQAREHGITSGMPLSEARTLVPSRARFVCESVHPEQDRESLIELAILAERFSFCIGLEEVDRPECLLLNVTGLEHLFGEERSLTDEIRQWLTSLHYDGRIGIAGTIGQAWASAHGAAQHGQPRVVAADEPAALEHIPLEFLRLSDAILSKLHRLGLETVGQVLSLDRPSLLRRFGEDLLRRLDQFTGQRSEFITPCRPQPRYRVERQFEEGLSTPETITALSSSLLEQLLEMLQPWRLGLRHLHGELQLDDRTSRTIDLRVCQATCDLRHLNDLLRPQWERVSLTAPLVGFSWEALDIGSLEADQREFFDTETRDAARQAAMLINRLVSRLGEEAVVVPELSPDPIPEHAVRWRPATQRVKESPSVGPITRLHSLDRPPVLYRTPRPVEFSMAAEESSPHVLLWNSRRLEIHRTWGPERIESGWWDSDPVCRDYYRAETAAGKRLWLFQRLQDGRWFWQGEW